MSTGDALFRGSDLSDFLGRRELSIQPIVTAQVNASNSLVPDDELAALLAQQLVVQPLVVDFEAVEKSVREARVLVNDFGRRIEIDGIRATRTFPFTGDGQFFYMKPSSYSSMLPYGTIEGNKISIAASGHPDNAERMKQELDREQELLQQYLDSQAKQIGAYNLGLKAKLEYAIAARRKSLGSIDAAKQILG
ncbi:MAG: hypothetical protein ACYC10_04705 [Allorhizobium sp.]